MNPLIREIVLLWLRARHRWWTWALHNIHPCHNDLPLVMHTQRDIAERIHHLEQERLK